MNTLNPSVRNFAGLIRDRWHIPDWDLRFPWWGPPAQCRILIYADGVIQFDGGSFQGLQHVIQLLASRAYFYVNFVVSTAHRDMLDPSATIAGPKKLTDLDVINNYDEIWFFGYNAGANLTAAEVTLLDQFMAAPKQGGVLVVGDHDTLGQGLTSQITRAGGMRLYPAPPNFPYEWNTSLVQRPRAAGQPSDPALGQDYYNFDDQSDDIPQTIRWKRYVTGGNVVARRSRPHPVLCGPDGPIDIIPDHEHEGEALAPIVVAGDSDWPTTAGHQEAPEVIAWGKIKDPTATRSGQEFGVISAYDGQNVDVGRILADSTWHHWFDINLMGLTGSSPPYTGFVASAAGEAALKKIDAYYLNVGVWLAPPSVQAAMRRAAWWSIIWQDAIVELPGNAPLWFAGSVGMDALGRWATRCAVATWIFPPPIHLPVIPWWEWVEFIGKVQTIDIPLEQYVAGGILTELTHTFGVHAKGARFPEGPPSQSEFDRAMDLGMRRGLDALVKQIEVDGSQVRDLVARRFANG